MGIMLGAMTLKVPQILTMFEKKTAQGVSITAEVSDIICNILGIGYNFHYGNAFSTYGENVFLLMQTVMLLYAAATFGNLGLSKFMGILAICGALLGAFMCDLVPEGVYSYNMYTLISVSKTHFLVLISQTSISSLRKMGSNQCESSC